MKHTAKNIRLLVFVGLFIALTTLGGLIRIPFFPVPLTLQTLMVYLSGIFLGSRYGALSQGLYLILGLSGLPLFTTGGGWQSVLQPTFGYLLGFPIGAGLIGFLISRHSRRKDLRFLVLSILAGCLAIYLPGVIYLMIYTKAIVGHPVDLGTVLWTGFVIFIPAEMIKIALACTITLKMGPILGNHKLSDKPIS